MKIDPTISNYIDASLERAIKRSEQSFKKEQDHHLVDGRRK